MLITNLLNRYNSQLGARQIWIRHIFLNRNVKLAYNYYRHCKVHSSGNPTKVKRNLQTTSLSWTMLVGDHGLLFPDTRFTAVTHRFRDALSFGKVYPPIWLRQSDTTHLPGIVHLKKDLFNVDLIGTRRTGSRYYRRHLSD